MASQYPSDRTTPSAGTAAGSRGTGGQGMTDQAGQMASQVREQAKQQANSKLSDQKTRAAQGLDGVAKAVAQVGDQMRQQNPTVANFADTAADQIRHLSTTLEQRDVSELLDEAERFARRNPMLFVGGAFALGLLGARFMKSEGESSNGNGGMRSTYGRRYDAFAATGGDGGIGGRTSYGRMSHSPGYSGTLAGDPTLADPRQRTGYADIEPPDTEG